MIRGGTPISNVRADKRGKESEQWRKDSAKESWWNLGIA